MVWSSFPVRSYLLIGLIMLFLACMLRPLLLLGLVVAALVLAWGLPRDSITVIGFPEGKNKLRGPAKLTALGGVCLLLVLLFAGPTVFAVVGMTGTIVLVHSVFYLPDPEAMEAEIQLEKDLEAGR